MDARTIFAVALGAAIGGVMRFGITQAVIARFGTSAAPAATAFINVSGSFAIGFVVETLVLRTNADPVWRAFLAIGILGGYTTFSTFSYEALGLATAGFAARAAAYVVGSVVLGIAGVLGGVWLARSLSPGLAG